MTAILRANYPVEHRGQATGEVRQWSSLAFVISSILSAYILHGAADYAAALDKGQAAAAGSGVWEWPARHMAQILMILAGLLNLASFLCFRQIRVEEEPDAPREAPGPGPAGHLRDAVALIMARNERFARYLLGCFLDGFCQALYLPMIWIILSRNLKFGYLECSVLVHAIPALAAFGATGALGYLFDRTNPWASWAGIRFVWGLDALLLAATPLAAAAFPPALFALPLLARLLRGSVQGAWWIMYWQVGVTYFAPPGEDTSRYMGLIVFINGSTRLLASLAGMGLAALSVPPSALLVAGGLGVILSGVYSLWQGALERRRRGPETMAEFEHRFDQRIY